ncbi:AAC(3) family N-acetyltransferase [Streptomyces sp. NPDC046909]|uniref:aminoglycoside N(3)-acetyltransferase n=1 Tax=Streptomyces sp. NPDC046909 TaxID=3155617 RepID=UPI00340758D9
MPVRFGRSLRAQLRAMGVRRGGVLLVHASLRWVGVGPHEVMAALLDVLGPKGTLVVPAFTPGNSKTSLAYLEATRRMTEQQRVDYDERMLAFEPGKTPSEGMGVLAETVRLHPDAERSAHPQTSFAAVGFRAADLVGGHDEECHLGERSPLAGLYEAKAQVLLLGVGYDVCSAFHLSEYLVDRQLPFREYGCWVLRGGERIWLPYKDVDLDDSDFGFLGEDFEAEDARRAEPVVRRRLLGGAAARLFPLTDAVDFATQWLTGNRPYGMATDQSQEAATSLH